ncbi:MAG: hypothetical protein J5701_06260 [Bacteroidales bacterium]|nr:hypothetical protein [Bacteroidales bacterium]
MRKIVTHFYHRETAGCVALIYCLYFDGIKFLSFLSLGRLIPPLFQISNGLKETRFFFFLSTGMKKTFSARQRTCKLSLTGTRLLPFFNKGISSKTVPLCPKLITIPYIPDSSQKNECPDLQII